MAGLGLLWGGGGEGGGRQARVDCPHQIQFIDYFQGGRSGVTSYLPSPLHTRQSFASKDMLLKLYFNQTIRYKNVNKEEE